MNTVLVDLQYGDCGKGKIADYLMNEHDICVRYSGGPNTGTTVWHGNQKYKLHHLPVGLLRNKDSYIASTCLIIPGKLEEEINKLKRLGFDVDSHLKISPYCHVITYTHIARDIKNEEAGNGVGSTKQGISPCSSDKYLRKGLRLFEWVANGENTELEKYFCDVSYELNNAINEGKNILFQSSQGTLLDIDHGAYPYVSTTNNIAAAAPMACGIGPQYIDKVVGVFKPYMTYVGTGPFNLEITDTSLNDCIAGRGEEYGTTTGRRRRIGWLSIPLLLYSCRINGVTNLAITKGDVLNGLTVFYDPYLHTGKAVDIFNRVPRLINYGTFELNKFVEFLNRNPVLPTVKYVSTGKSHDQIIIL
jgi:adenylosuccinate synthase